MLQAQLGQRLPVHDTALQARMGGSSPSPDAQRFCGCSRPAAWPAPASCGVLCITCLVAPGGRGGGSMPPTRSLAGLQAPLPAA